jgi:peptidyl-tRNA hydrolase, PTH1 family
VLSSFRLGAWILPPVEATAVKLIVGLGNPGDKYKDTRHNVGFEVAARLARRHGSTPPRARFQGETVEAAIAGQKILLLTPLTYMNLSGASVLAARDFYKIEHADILVVCDDFNLPLARLRLRGKGSAGGQKGLDDILRRLGTDEIPRLRIGIGSAPAGRDVTGHVLGRFPPEDRPTMAAALDRAAEAAAAWVELGLTQAANRYNAEPETKTDKAEKKTGNVEKPEGTQHETRSTKSETNANDPSAE